jgi:hypothetical protein
MHTKYWMERLKGRDYMGHLYVNGRMIGLNCLRIESSGGVGGGLL